jgi:hypothetical protein
MSTELSLFQNDLPDFLKNAEPDALTKALAGNTSNKRISIRGNVFRMVVGGEEVRKSDSRSLQFIVVNASPHVARQYYAGAYDPENKGAADCWSLDGKTPDATAENKQHTDCTGCSQNIKGSGQGDSRACRYLRRLAVTMPGDPDVYQLVVPSQSIFGKGDKDSMPFDQYVKFVASNRRSINTVVTQASFDTDSATPKLFFDAVAHVTEAQYNAAVAAGATDEAKRAISYSVNANASDGANKKKALPAPEAKSVEAEAPVADATPEPKKRASKEVKVEPKKDLQDIMKQWAE